MGVDAGACFSATTLFNSVTAAGNDEIRLYHASHAQKNPRQLAGNAYQAGDLDTKNAGACRV